MSHTYASDLVHVVFSTKERRPYLEKELRPKVWAYIGGIARRNGFKAMTVGGCADHAHVLLQLPTEMPIAKAVQLIKGGSSKWLGEQLREFSWQQGYGAFSIGISQIRATVATSRDKRNITGRCPLKRSSSRS